MMTHVAQDALRSTYREGYGCAKAGVILTHIVDAEDYTADMFCPGDSAQRRRS